MNRRARGGGNSNCRWAGILIVADHPFAMWRAFPTSDYYGDSVALGLASRRRSRVPSLLAFFSNWIGAFAHVATVGLDLPEGSHGERSLYQFKSQLPSDELSGTLQGLDRYVALCLENPIDLSAACVH